MTATDQDLEEGKRLARALGVQPSKIVDVLREQDGDGSAMAVVQGDLETKMRKMGLSLAEWAVVHTVAAAALGRAHDYPNARDQLHLVVWEKKEAAELEALLNRVVFGVPTLGIVAINGGWAAVSENQKDPK